MLGANTRVVTLDVGLRNWKQKQSGRLSRGISEKAKENLAGFLLGIFRSADYPTYSSLV